MARPRFRSAMSLLQTVEKGLWLDRQGDISDLGQGEIAPEPLLTGDHLVQKGFRPGPAFRTVLEQVYDAQLEGRVRSLAEAFELATQFFRGNPG
jgi:poly(A) polymerase